MNQLQKALQPVMTKMIDELAERVYETLNDYLGDYYTGWTPDSSAVDILIMAYKYKNKVPKKVCDALLRFEVKPYMED